MTSSVKNLILHKRTQIQTNISHVQTNEQLCRRLCLRIDQLTDPLERLEYATSVFIRKETRSILDSLLQCLDDCNHFIEKLKYSDQSYEKTNGPDKNDENFEELNNRLSQLGEDLCLALNIQELYEQKQYRIDQRQIVQELNKKIDEISQTNLQLKEHNQRVEKMMKKKFESFHFRLEQKLFSQSDSIQKKY